MDTVSSFPGYGTLRSGYGNGITTDPLSGYFIANVGIRYRSPLTGYGIALSGYGIATDGIYGCATVGIRYRHCMGILSPLSGYQLYRHCMSGYGIAIDGIRYRVGRYIGRLGGGGVGVGNVPLWPRSRKLLDFNSTACSSRATHGRIWGSTARGLHGSIDSTALVRGFCFSQIGPLNSSFSFVR